MFYFLYGDVAKATTKAKQTVDALLKRQPDAARFKLDSDNWSTADFQEFMGGQGLFSNRYIVELRRIFEHQEAEDVVLQSLEELAASPNVFMWVEPKVTAVQLKKIEKYAEKVQEFMEVIKNTKPQFNIFSLGEALGMRDKKKLWLLFVDAQSCFVAEEIHGTLFWQVKSMLLAAQAKSAEDAGMKSFPYTKAKGYAKNYSHAELVDLSQKLLTVSHGARRGRHSFSVALERFVLEI